MRFLVPAGILTGEGSESAPPHGAKTETISETHPRHNHGAACVLEQLSISEPRPKELRRNGGHPASAKPNQGAAQRRVCLLALRLNTFRVKRSTWLQRSVSCGGPMFLCGPKGSADPIGCDGARGCGDRMGCGWARRRSECSKGSAHECLEDKPPRLAIATRACASVVELCWVFAAPDSRKHLCCGSRWQLRPLPRAKCELQQRPSLGDADHVVHAANVRIPSFRRARCRETRAWYLVSSESRVDARSCGPRRVLQRRRPTFFRCAPPAQLLPRASGRPRQLSTGPCGVVCGHPSIPVVSTGAHRSRRWGSTPGPSGRHLRTTRRWRSICPPGTCAQWTAGPDLGNRQRPSPRESQPWPDTSPQWSHRSCTARSPASRSAK